MPELFTQTPIESHIIALCLKIQTAFAAVIVGSGAIKSVFLVILGVVLLVRIAKMGFGAESVASSTAKIVFHLALMAIGLSFLGRSAPQVKFKSVGADREWSSMAKVRANEELAATLGGRSEGLLWYAQIAGGFGEVSKVLTDTISETFSDPTLRDDPTFAVKQLAKTSLASTGVFGADSARNLDALVIECSDTKNGKLLRNMSSVRELFDTATPRCAQLWGQFENSLNQMSDSLLQIYEPNVLQKTKLWLSSTLGIGDSEKAIRNTLVANAMVNYMENRAGFTDSANRTVARDATFSDASDRLLEGAANGAIAEGYLNILDIFMDDSHGSALKAEAANRFNMIAPLIPPARGWIAGTLAILFVFAAASLCFGTTKFMLAWLLAIGTFSLYKPASVLGYQVTKYFTNQSTLGDVLGNLANDPLLLGGVSVIRNQLTYLQTTYLAFETGCFTLFMVGAIAAFSPLSSLTNRAGIYAMSNLGHTIQGLRYVMRSPGMRQTANINSRPAPTPSHSNLAPASFPSASTSPRSYTPSSNQTASSPPSHVRAGATYWLSGGSVGSPTQAAARPSAAWGDGENWNTGQKRYEERETT